MSDTTALLTHACPAPQGIAETCDLSALRTAVKGLKMADTPPWLRAQTWRLLLGYLPDEKGDWLSTVRRRRSDYQLFFDEFVGNIANSKSNDRLLDQVYKDLERATRSRGDFLLSQTGASAMPAGSVTRQVLLERLAAINRDFGSRGGLDSAGDLMWHVMLRILFLYALLNPSVGYIQGMHEVLYVLLNVLHAGSTRSPNAPPKGSEEGQVLAIGEPASVEADTFWCFSLLIGELHELYDFCGRDPDTIKAMRSLELTSSQGHENGMVQALTQFNRELQWLDPELHGFLEMHSLHPRLPYYAFRWLVCVYAADFSLPHVVQFWDVILAQQFHRRAQSGTNTNEKISFMIDIGCALLMHTRQVLLYSPNTTTEGDKDVFGFAMSLLGSYPLRDAARIVVLAQQIQRRREIDAIQQPAELPRDNTSRRLPLQARLRGLTSETRAVSSVSTESKRLSESESQRDEPQRAATWSAAESSRRPLLQRYAEVIQDSNAAASLAKASTNLAAKAISWRSGSGQGLPQAQQQHRSSPLHRVEEPPELPIPSVIDSPDDLDAHRAPRAPISFGSPMRKRSLFSSPNSSQDESFTSMTPGTQLVLPSMRTAAQIHSPKSDDNRVFSAPRPLLLSNSYQMTPSRTTWLRQGSSSSMSPLANKSYVPAGDTSRGSASDSPLQAPAAPVHAALRISPPRFHPEARATPPPNSDPLLPLQRTPGRPLPPLPHAGSPQVVEHLDALMAQMQTSDFMTNNPPA